MAMIAPTNWRAPFSAASSSGGSATSYVYVSGDLTSTLAGLSRLGDATWIKTFIIANASSGGSGTRTIDVTLQSSTDGTNWDDVVAFTQLTHAGGNERKDANRLSSTPGKLGIVYRFKFVAAAGTGTTTWTGTVGLLTE